MIDRAIEVRMAPAREMKLIDMELPAPATQHYAQGGQAINTLSPAHPVRPGMLAEFSEFRTLVFNRFEDLEQQIVHVRNRVRELESHVFGDGPQAVRG